MTHDDRERFYIDCTCGCSTIRITYWKDWPEIDFAILRYRNWSGTSFRERLRHIWDIIKYGDPWADEICLEIQDLDDLIKKLQSFQKKIQKGVEGTVKNDKKREVTS